MKKIRRVFKLLTLTAFFIIAGCATLPQGLLKPDQGYLSRRQLQMRQYETTNQEQVISSVAGVLQDLGFTLEDSELALGFVAASKKADAKSKGQITGAVILDVLSSLGGSASVNNTANADNYQVIKASVITKPSLDNKETVVRVTFQRIVWNMSNQINRVETIKEPEIYQKFYNSLSKAIFLEAQQI
ncbi:MAG: hypothetical protein WC394_03880 [Candidatus Omnitrophota bacterium]